MKVECLLEKLKGAVAQIEKVSGKNLTLPILGAILIQTDEASLIFRATNLNIGAEIKIPAKIIEHGTVAVSAALLAQICSGLIGDIPVTLESINENLLIQTKRSKLTLRSMNAEDFPTLPRIQNTESFEIPIDQFILGIKAVAYSASLSDIKPEIASVYLYPDNDQLVFVATDAYRLAEKKVSVKNMAQFPEILIPVKNVSDIVRILGEYSGFIDVSIAENQISFSNTNVYITSRLTGGSYPNYRQIMPKESKTEVVILKSDLQNILKSIMVFSDKFNQIDLVVNPNEKVCTMTSRNGDTGEGIVSVEAALSGDPIETFMNHRYITDAFQSISMDSVSFSFTEPNKAMVMKGVGDPSFTYLVMPMNR
jgi:DNA polymerase-3 subunit beta